MSTAPQRFRNYVDNDTIKLDPVTGVAFATVGAYEASLVGNDSLVAGATVKDALNTLLGSIGAGEVVQKVQANSGSTFPMILGAFAAGAVVNACVLAILTPFDPGVRAQLGTSADPSIIFDVPLDAPATVQYGDGSLTIFDVPDLLELSVDPSSTGSLLLLYKAVL
jgi:hypothetical protein